MKVLLTKRKTPLIKGVEEGNEKLNGYLLLTDSFQLQFKAEEKKEMTCPRCQQGHLLKGKKAYGCSRYREGCQFLVPFEFMGKTLTEKQIEALVLKRRTPLIKKLTAASGQEVQVRIIVNDTNQIEFVPQPTDNS